MKELLYGIVGVIAKFHSYFMNLNDQYALNLTDKQLHFVVIGLLGMAMIFVIQPIFTILAKTGHVMVITWIYTFTVILVITFAIEIGQKATGTGVMEFADIMFGVVGFLVMFAIYGLLREIVKSIIGLITHR
ncbi:MAG: hypothetical protein HUJ71_06585 [Pseudobutyrivibrio sp.]|nr:hypothetical protein [Pseudobutyrivibrio sp.]